MSPRSPRLGEPVDAEAGAILMDQGDVGTECFFVIDGNAGVFSGGQHIAEIGPGSIVGEMALVGHKPRNAQRGGGDADAAARLQHRGLQEAPRARCPASRDVIMEAARSTSRGEPRPPVGRIRGEHQCRMLVAPSGATRGPPAGDVLGDERLQGVGVLGGADGAAAVVEQAHDDPRLRVAVAVVHGGPRLDGDLAVGVLAELALGERVDLGLHVGVPERRGRRFGAVHAEGVLGDEPAVGADEAEGAGVVAQPTGHRGDRVHHVVVPRSAGEGEATGDRERAIGADAELVGRDLHRRREARVEVDVRQIVDAHAAPAPATPARPRAWRGSDRGRRARSRSSGRGRPCRCAGTPSGRAARRALRPARPSTGSPRRPAPLRCWSSGASCTGSRSSGCRAKACGSPRRCTPAGSTRAGWWRPPR